VCARARADVQKFDEIKKGMLFLASLKTDQKRKKKKGKKRKRYKLLPFIRFVSYNERIRINKNRLIDSK
jgi:hypothetical protein